jgi:hypothetical protein
METHSAPPTTGYGFEPAIFSLPEGFSFLPFKGNDPFWPLVTDEGRFTGVCDLYIVLRENTIGVHADANVAITQQKIEVACDRLRAEQGTPVETG